MVSAALLRSARTSALCPAAVRQICIYLIREAIVFPCQVVLGWKAITNCALQEKIMLTAKRLVFFPLVAVMLAAGRASAAPAPVADYYTEPAFYESRPDPRQELNFGDVGVTGLKLRIYPGVVLTVDSTRPGTPAAGKFAKGEIVTGVNGFALKGHNPFVAIGNALTEAEAKDGKLVFDVLSADCQNPGSNSLYDAANTAGGDGAPPSSKIATNIDSSGGRRAVGAGHHEVTVTIPVLGAYSPTWPMDCKKSQAIIQGAAAYYSRTMKYADVSDTDREEQLETCGIGGALASLFLLSTGDDQYLPRVKTFCDGLAQRIKDGAVFENPTWYVGYDGLACAEYYLRTGDRSALPTLQHYCDYARDAQICGISWGHDGHAGRLDYVAGSMLNSAGAQLVTMLLLAKECDVQVDEKTLQGALHFLYRFAGRGSIAYGDHRGEGWLGSANGKDGSVAAAMQIACDAAGKVEIYQLARDYFALGTVISTPVLVRGHADDGRGDAIWRGLASAYMREIKPAAYQAALHDLRWWYDLSRRPSGALGVATCKRYDDEGSGAGVALAYTAPRKTLRMTGAPRSKYARSFTLPEQQWGRPADLAFLSLENGKPYFTYGADEPTYAPFFKLGSAYSAAAKGAELPRSEMLKNVYHWNYTIRTEAAKTLLHVGAFGELEKLLQDQDPRVRRAALDGLTDYKYWFAIGEKPICTEDFSPAMVASIRKMLADPDEAWFVVDGALLALSRSPTPAIAESLPLILPWTTHEEWWLREAAFLDLLALARDAAFAPKVLPVMTEMMVQESRPQCRELMVGEMARLGQKYKKEHSLAKLIVAAFQSAASETEITPGAHANEGSFYVVEAVAAGLKVDPERAIELAKTVRRRFAQLKTGDIDATVHQLLALREKLPEQARGELTDLLYDDYRRELITRMNAGETLLDSVLLLTQLKHPEYGWHELGKPASSNRVCQFISFEPQGADSMNPREGKRFRDVALPAGLENWYLPEFDTRKWSSGRTPIGKGAFKQGKTVFENRSAWGEGEFLLLRTTFDLESLDCDYYRISILANQGYHIYLNGHKVHTYIWWSGPNYAPILLSSGSAQHLKKGTNILAIYANSAYPKGVAVGQLDMRLEGLQKAELLGETAGKPCLVKP